ncbi:hypothetical protein D3C84_1238400 [compost metagenome]
MLLQRLMTVSIAVRKHGSVHPASTEKDSPARYNPELALRSRLYFIRLTASK